MRPGEDPGAHHCARRGPPDLARAPAHGRGRPTRRTAPLDRGGHHRVELVPRGELVVAVGAVATLVANLVAIGPSWTAGKIQPSMALRSE